MSLNENITKFRNAAGETQGQLADVVGVSNRTVSKWECGEGEPDVAMLMKIAGHYGVTLDDLCGYKAAKKADGKALSADEAALRAYSEAFDTLQNLKSSMNNDEDDGFVPPSLLRKEYQEENCRATGIFSSRIYSLFVNSKENNMALTLMRNRENFKWIAGNADDFTKLLGFLAEPDIRKLLCTLFTDTFPYRFTAEFAAETAGIPVEKAEAFLEYAVWHNDVELLEGKQRIYRNLDSGQAGLYMAVLCCAYEIIKEDSTYFEIWKANYQPILGEKIEKQEG